jgi:2-hydroxychromene-2-carboxylate isomerase
VPDRPVFYFDYSSPHAYLAAMRIGEVDAAEAAGLDRDAMAARLENPAIKERLRTYTDDAIAGGVTGVPTVAVRGALFWGDDLLESAAAAFV